MSKDFRFIPLNFNWVALNPHPKGVVYFIGGIFFGSFPNIFYHFLLKKVFEAGYTVVAIPFRFTFRHWSVSIDIIRDIIDLRQAIYDEAKFRGYTDNIELYHKDPTKEKCKYFWLGHSLGCKYISLLEILTEINTEEDLQRVLGKCIQNQQARDIKNALGDLKLQDVSLENQPSLFLAPVISGIENAIPFTPGASFIKQIGLDVQPTVIETECLIQKSSMFSLIDLITFAKDVRAKTTIQWFLKTIPGKILSQPVVPLPEREHLAPLGWSNGDQELAKKVIQSISNLCQK